YRIMLFPLQSLTFVATRSLYPVLSHHQDDNKKIASIYLNCTFFVLFLSAPLMSGIAVLSVPFVNWVFGPQWHITANILTWLAP
ncbi:oligosaccharide flippase family protein, partial [Klebsiella pneumoniae]